MDESPAMKELWQSAMWLRNVEMATAATQWNPGKMMDCSNVTRSNQLTEITTTQDPGRQSVATAVTYCVQQIEKGHQSILPRLKFVDCLVKQVSEGIQSIRGPSILASASTTALATLPTSTPPSFCSHPFSGDENLLPPQSWTDKQSFDAFLDSRDLESISRSLKERPAWIEAPAERTLALAEKVAENAVEGWSGFIKPVDKMWEMSSSFGPRWGRYHNGVDLAAPTGEPILASDSGEVTFAGWDSGYGNLVEITHRDGLKTLYAHNSENYTWEGQFVRRGQCIASVGETGRATGPHLHWEIRNRNGKPIDPSDHVKL